MTTRWLTLLTILSVLMAGGALAEDMEQVRAAVLELTEFAAISSNSANGEGVRRAAAWLEKRFSDLGLETTILEQQGGNPLVFAQHRAAGTTDWTVLFYMHYDTQPTGPPADWPSTGGDPFAPALLTGRYDEPGSRPIAIEELDGTTVKTARLYARGVADDKAPIVMHLQVLRKWLKTPASRRLTVKYLLDGEEEAGSPSIGASLKEHGDLLKADLLVLCDGPMDALERASVYLGTRGDMHMRLRVQTASASGHSGNYGLLPNAAWRLASLLASMKDAQGNVTVEGFLDDVVAPTSSERVALALASEAEPAIARQFGVESFEGDPLIPYYERLLFRPSLIINHIDAGRPGNQIPHEAEALLEVRLVAEQEPAKVYEAFRRHVERHMPEAVLENLGGTRAGKMDPEHPSIARALAAAGAAAGGDLVVYPSLGGTLPLLHSFEEAGHRYIGVPLVNFDNNQHVANENLRVGVMESGIHFLRGFLDGLAANPR